MKLPGRILFLVITAIVAFALIFAANYYTKAKAQENEEEKIEAAFEAVFPDADSFDEARYNPEYLNRYLAENGLADDAVYVNQVTFARNELRDVQGIVVQVSAYKKFGGYISMLVGIRNDGTLNGYYILRIYDAKGVDFKVRNSEFADQFVNKKVDAFNLVSYKATLPGDIVAASGAEDASQAVVNAANATIKANIFIDEYYGGMLN